MSEWDMYHQLQANYCNSLMFVQNKSDKLPIQWAQCGDGMSELKMLSPKMA